MSQRPRACHTNGLAAAFFFGSVICDVSFFPNGPICPPMNAVSVGNSFDVISPLHVTLNPKCVSNDETCRNLEAVCIPIPIVTRYTTLCCLVSILSGVQINLFTVFQLAEAFLP